MPAERVGAASVRFRLGRSPAPPHLPDADVRWRALAARLGLRYVERIVAPPLPATDFLPSPEVFERADRILLGAGDDALLIAAPADAVLASVEAHLARHPDLSGRFAIAAPHEIRRALLERHAAALLRRAILPETADRVGPAGRGRAPAVRSPDPPPPPPPVGAMPVAEADDHWRGLARRLGLRHLDRLAVAPLPETAFTPAPEVFARADRMLVGAGDAAILVAAPDEAVVASVEAHLARHPDLTGRFAIAAPHAIRRALVERHAAGLLRRAIGSVCDVDPAASAARPISARQVGVLVAVAIAWVVAVLDLSRTDLALWSVTFLVLGVLRARIADAVPAVRVDPPVAEADLPRVAVLVPLLREAEVVADLVAALGRLDYPADRLDVRLICEADDADTRAAVERAIVGTGFAATIVPAARPRTKPKALDFALATVDAPYVTVYDAEARPDPDQLRRAAAAFRAGGPDLAVVQAALDIDHADGHRPWLVRQFEIEYAVLFHGLLPWLAKHRLFLPLGGTSNHFRREALVAVGGWDPHNVTEDADVAVRLMRHGWRADVIPSSTLEEAPLDLASWWAQRTRWLKGWVQTWLVHMRRPWRFHREVTLPSALSFHLVLAGQLASIFVFAPSLLLFLAQVTGILPLFDDRDFLDDLLLVASLLGFTLGIAGSVILADRVSGRGSGAHRRRPPRLLDLATMPLYWCLISLCAYRALWDLVAAPHVWNKTTHGLAERRSDRDEEAVSASCATAGGEAIDVHPRAGVVQG